MRAFYEVKELKDGAWLQLGDGKIMYSHDRGLRLLAALHKLNPSKTLGLHQTSTQIIETKAANIKTQFGGTYVCPKCMRIHDRAKGCGIRDSIEDELIDLWQWGHDGEPRNESVQPRLDAILKLLNQNQH